MKHQLKYRGAPHTAEGILISRETAGEGCSLCSCGWVSDTLPSGAARRAAHENHVVREFIAAGTVEPEPEPEPVTKVLRSSVVARHVFWTVLGSRAIQYAEGAEGITEVSCDTASRDIYITGTPEAVEAVLKVLRAFWKRGEQIRAKAFSEGPQGEIAALREWVREAGEPK